MVAFDLDVFRFYMLSFLLLDLHAQKSVVQLSRHCGPFNIHWEAEGPDEEARSALHNLVVDDGLLSWRFGLTILLVCWLFQVFVDNRGSGGHCLNHERAAVGPLQVQFVRLAQTRKLHINEVCRNCFANVNNRVNNGILLGELIIPVSILFYSICNVPLTIWWMASLTR
jgi:hypothetical protein